MIITPKGKTNFSRRKFLRLLLLLLFLFSFSLLFATKKCPKCGFVNPDKNKICEKCGNPLIRRIQIPLVVGKDKEEAIKILESKNFSIRIEEIPSEESLGKVLRQSPVGSVECNTGSRIKVTIWVGVPPTIPKWVRKIMTYEGWPVEGKGMAGILIGDSINSVTSTLGEPTQQEENFFLYQWENEELKISFREGRVDTLAIKISPFLREKLNTPISLIQEALREKEPEEEDSIKKVYFQNGIVFIFSSDKLDTLIELKVFAPRKEPFWITTLKKYGINLTSLSVGLLGIGMYSDSITILLGKPNKNISNTLIYEYLDNYLQFSIVGDEIDTITISLTQELLDSMPIPKTMEEINHSYSKATISNDTEMIYPDLGFNLKFNEMGFLKDIKLYQKKYYNMVLIPAGKFILGTSQKDIRKIQERYPKWKDEYFVDETPQRIISLTYSYYIDKYEVTNRQFQKFVKATGYEVKGDWKFEPGKENYPAVGVTWEDANAYAEWVGKRLPTEIEWEKAARCSLGIWFPWGNDFYDAPNFANYDSSRIGRLIPVDSLEGGKSPYGVFNMAGNAMEWCANPYDADYYKWLPKIDPKGTEGIKSDTFISVRGGSFLSSLFGIRCSYRYYFKKDISRGDLGFRCVKDIKGEEK